MKPRSPDGSKMTSVGSRLKYTIFHSARFDGGFINLGGTSPARKGLLTRLQKLAEDEDLRKEIARLQHIGRVLCWMLGVLNDDPSELPPADLDRMADGMAIICNETEVLLKDKSFLEIYSRKFVYTVLIVLSVVQLLIMLFQTSPLSSFLRDLF